MQLLTLKADVISWSPSSGREVCVCGMGARTPLGFSAAASAAAVRGAISAVGAHPVFVDKAGEPMALAFDAEFDAGLAVPGRMQRMLVSAISEALGDTFVPQKSARVHCFIGLPEPRPGLPSTIAETVSSAVSSAFDISPSAVHILQRGHASGLMAIQAAAQIISSGEEDICLATGVDSYHDPDTLKWLDQSGLLMSSSNRNGFPPSEAAGACLLASRPAADRYGLPLLAAIMAASTAVEPHNKRSTKVCIGEGLSSALNGVISGLRLPQQAITATYCDLNGERYRNEEFVYTLLRMQEAFADAHNYLCPADCWGDVGAASGPLFASLAITASQRGYAEGSLPVLWAASESGHRTAVLLNLANV